MPGMNHPTTPTGRHVRTEDLLPPPPIARALVFAGMGALLGAAAWSLLAFYAHREFGLLAWAIGGVIGFATVKAGGHGTMLAACAGALALLSIGSGKHLAFQLFVDKEAERFAAQLDSSAHQERAQDAADWIALGEQPTAEQVRAFAAAHRYAVEDTASFAREEGARLRQFAAEKPSLDQWREQVRVDVTSGASFVTFLQDDFHPADILFVLLGVASAFGLVSKATVQLQVAARQAAREQREAGAPPAS